MKFLQMVIFLYLHSFISDSKLNYHKIMNNKQPNNINNICSSSTDLPIKNRILFLKQVYKLKHNGTDDRYPASENITEEEKHNIYKNYENKRKLDLLQNEYISIYDKLQLVEDNSIKPYNLAAGGLMDDYEIEL